MPQSNHTMQIFPYIYDLAISIQLLKTFNKTNLLQTALQGHQGCHCCLLGSELLI